MPKDTFYRLAADKRERLVAEAISEFAERPFEQASLSQIAARAGVSKGSVYQYFDNKLDLYRWLLTDEVPRRKRAFLAPEGEEPDDFWEALTRTIERGIAFLVVHPRLARMTAAGADSASLPEVRGLHREVCHAGIEELRRQLERGQQRGVISEALDLSTLVHLVDAIIGPGLTAAILHELDADLSTILRSDELRARLHAERRMELAGQAVAMIRNGLGARADAKHR